MNAGFPFWIPSEELMIDDVLSIAGMTVSVDHIYTSGNERHIFGTIQDENGKGSLMSITIEKSAQVAIVR